jgi:transcriptional regulator with XRE-family HTH domain
MMDLCTERKVNNASCKGSAPPDPETITLPYGELQRLADLTGRSVSHLSRFLRGDRPSKALEQIVRREYGVPSSRIVVSRRRHPLPAAG